MLNGRNSPGFLQVESDILVTESQVLNIETTITETFTVNSNEMQDDFDLRSKKSGGLFVKGQGERSEEGSMGSTALDSLDIYSDRFERAFEFEEARSTRKSTSRTRASTWITPTLYIQS